MTPACRLNRNKSEVCFDRLAPVMERSRRMASNWSGVPQAGRRYIRPGRIIGLMGHSCVWTRRPSALFGGGKKTGLENRSEAWTFFGPSLHKNRRFRRRSSDTFSAGTGWTRRYPRIHLLWLEPSPTESFQVPLKSMFLKAFQTKNH